MNTMLIIQKELRQVWGVSAAFLAVCITMAAIGRYLPVRLLVTFAILIYGVFVVSAVDTERPGPDKENVYRFVVMCVDRETGKTVWEKVAIEQAPHEGVQQTNTFAPGPACRMT